MKKQVALSTSFNQQPVTASSCIGAEQILVKTKTLEIQWKIERIYLK